MIKGTGYEWRRVECKSAKYDAPRVTPGYQVKDSAILLIYLFNFPRNIWVLKVKEMQSLEKMLQ